jgi:propanediol utilization protein
MANKKDIDELEVENFEAIEADDNEDGLDEETAAAASIAPKGKAASINVVMDLMNKMSGEDLNKFVATMQQFAPNKDYGVGDNSNHNRSTIAMKEDLDALFDGYELSEEFKETTTTLFEAAVNARVIAESARLEEEFATKLEEELAVFSEEMTDKLDAYLNYAVENFMKENEVAIESTLRNELAEEFMEGLKNLFAEHYISVPQEKVDVLEAMAEKVEALESKLDEVIVENTELRGVILSEAAVRVFTDLASDLALTQQEKFAALAEGIEFDGDLDVYSRKLNIIKESYFKGDSQQYSSNIEEETFEGEVAEKVYGDPQVSRYVQALARTIKK